jgi:catechol 2,3-dioxygenase-like lactoylglutathione lyase family enzyme
VEVLSSRVLLHPADLERSLRFYGDTLGLAVYREYGSGPDRGVVFFLGGGFLELSGSGGSPDGSIGLWLQVRDLDVTERDLRARGVEIERPAERKPWGLCELWARDPDGVRLVIVEVPEDHPLRRSTP